MLVMVMLCWLCKAKLKKPEPVPCFISVCVNERARLNTLLYSIHVISDCFETYM